jgi:subtilisin family serine protease
MSVPGGSGEYIWRGGERIPLVREDEFITFVIEDERDLQVVREIEGVESVEQVVDRVYKAHVLEAERDRIMALVRTDDRGIVTHHAYHPEGDEATRYYLTDEINVQFGAGVSNERIEQIIEQARLVVLRQFPDEHGVTILAKVTNGSGGNPIKIANWLAELDEVVFAEPNLVNRFEPSYTPTDPLFQYQWHLRSWNGPQVAEDADVSAEAAWDVTRGERSVVVAIIDDGFDLTHPDLQGDGKVVFPKDFVDSDTSPMPETAAGDYHGTPVAGVAIGEENGIGIVGVAPGCAFLPIRFPLSASDSFLWEIFDYAGQRADIISCSWGPPPVYAPIGQLLSNKFTQLANNGGPRKKGCLIFFAAGNNNSPLNDPANRDFQWRDSSGRLRRTTGPILSGQAAHPATIAVAASTSQNRKSAYSCWGREIDICAPSNNFHPIHRNEFVPGLGIVTTDNEPHGAGFSANSRYTSRFGGTSSATPLAAGVAALVISANPSLTAAEVREILRNTADKIVDSNPDVVLGHSKGSYDDNGHSEWFGYGRVNASAAVLSAIDALPADAPVPLVLQACNNGELSGDGDTTLYRIIVGSRLTVSLEGPDGEDFDLYVKRDGTPSTTDYDARGFGPTANESITIEPLESGEYQILVRSYRGSGQYRVKVETG